MEAQKTGIIYCRVSSKEQVEGTSLSSQEKACLEYAERNNIKGLKVYIEQGESAKTANRTEFKKALAFCADKKNKVDYFIVYKIDRFTRNQDDHVTVRAILKKGGTELRSVTEPIDESSMGRAMEGMLSVFAELDNNMRTERVTQGMLERLKQGIWPWPEALGYMRPYKGSNIAPDPNTSPLIRLGFEEYSKGIYTYKSIAHYLNERGLRTKNGKLLTPQFMEKTLKKPIYYGVMKVWGEYRGNFEPIISESLFLSCQKGYKGSVHASPRSVNNPLFPLRRVIACSDCETPFTGSISKGRHGKGYAYYHHHHKGCEKAKSIPKEDFEKKFKKYLKDISPDGEYEKLFKMVVLDIWQNSYKKIDEDNTKIRIKIAKLESERQKVFDFHRTGKYTDDDFNEQKNIINQQINQQHTLIQAKREEEFEMEELLDYCFSYIRNSEKSWNRAEYAEKISLQKLIFAGRVIYDGEKLGTADLRLMYKINQLSLTDKSLIVVPRGVEPLFSG